MSTSDPSIARVLSEKARASRKRLREESAIEEQKAVQDFFAQLMPLADEAASAGANECWLPFSRKHKDAINTAVYAAGFINCVWQDNNCSVSWPVLPDGE